MSPSTDEKLDRIAEDVAGILTLQAVQTEQLKEHMRRTEMAEKNLAGVWAELDPLKRAAAMWAGVGKAVAIVAGAGSVIGAVVKLLAHH